MTEPTKTIEERLAALEALVAALVKDRIDKGWDTWIADTDRV